MPLCCREFIARVSINSACSLLLVYLFLFQFVGKRELLLFDCSILFISTLCITVFLWQVSAAGYDRQGVADHANNLASKIRNNLTNSMKALGVDILTGIGTVLVCSISRLQDWIKINASIYM